MKIKVTHLGVLRQAELELGDMTIICGENNTGKTYATYALYGFLMFWKEAFSVDVDVSLPRRLLEQGKVVLNLKDYIKHAEAIVTKACAEYTPNLPTVFGSSERRFRQTTFSINLLPQELKPLSSFSRTFRTAKREVFSISKEPKSPNIEVTLLLAKDESSIPASQIGRAIGDAIQDILFNGLFPVPFIASAERTGAAIFRKELDFARNRLLEQMSTMDRNLNPFDLLNRVYSDYPLPVRRNVDFTRRLEDVAKKESFLSKQHPELLNAFANIIGGEYRIIRDGLYFIPNSNKRLRLSMDESSSGVRSLLDIGFYLRHVAQPGNLLIVDEPELNLHPENQRLIARLFARLVNLGIKVFITTHSDYIIKELNTLIMLNQPNPRMADVRRQEKYLGNELLNIDQLRVYVAQKSLVDLPEHSRRSRVPTLTLANINPEIGVEVPSFDTAIGTMNRIQETILFGDQE
jgi:predicted ATPase